MGVLGTLPTNPHFTNDSGHVADHNLIVTALGVVDGYLSGASTSYTPTFGNITSGAGTFKYKMITEKLMFIRGRFTAGTVTATGAITISLPAGKTGVADLQPILALTAATVVYAGVLASDTKVSYQSQTGGQSLVGYAFEGIVEVI